MRTPIIFLFIGLMFQKGTAATLRLEPATFTQGKVVGRRVEIAPDSSPRTNALGLLILAQKYTTNTPSSGVLYLSNVLAGSYSVLIAGDPPTPAFGITVPETNGVVNAADIINTAGAQSAANAGYTKSQIDALLAALPASTNATSSVFDFDGNGDLTPSTTITADAFWQTDTNGNLTPK